MLLPGLVLGYLVMGLIWPWSIMELGNPLQALTYFSHFFEKPWKEMFDGALVSVPDMPWSYLPTLFALQTAGSAAGIVACRRRRHLRSRCRATDVTGAAQDHPPDADARRHAAAVIAMVKRPALYNGIRHFIFVIPPMAVLAGVALRLGACDWLRRQPARLAAGGARRVHRSACCCRSAK